MIERVSDHTFGCNKEHHPLKIKNDYRLPWIKGEQRHLEFHLLELLVEEGSKGNKPQMILLHPHKTMSKIKRMNKMKINLMIKRKALIKGEIRMMGIIKDQD
jgi:hypothetical protein